ncbi:uncharacterized protein LOC113334544 [Papaver somniferum]|uniref:uncharacterized protein LOC113334544 n=1 Tax=Papaver somniferum TaxID=3469 RepID=UPI000E6FDFC0|nr:uncharacterized protein LOC113334544 [Papaver somniferum]
MGKLISPVQCAYIKGRKVIDDTLITFELVDSRLKSGNAGIVCKIDLEKDFDRINWKYLEFLLTQMRFNWKWYKWPRFRCSTSSVSVLKNDSFFAYFSSTRDVSLGCPFSKLLFNIATEGFSRYMDKKTHLNLFSGFSVLPSSVIVIH